MEINPRRIRFIERGAVMKEYDGKKKDLYWQIAGLEHELKQYKDIEDELGIDLVTLIKALKNGIYASMYGGKPDNEINKIIHISPRSFKLCLHNGEPHFYHVWGWPGPDYSIYYLKDYGKTWTLTKED